MSAKRPEPLTTEKLYDYALKSLGRRAHSRGELRVKLQRKAAAPQDVETVLGRLQEAGYLNDRRFAESYAAARLENQGLGSMRVLRDLRQRRVAPKLAGDVVEKVFENTEETVLVEAYLARKYPGRNLRSLLTREKELASVYRRLRYAGFSGGASLRVLRRYATAADAVEPDDLDPSASDGAAPE